jgi:hypothetical protein
MPGSNLALAMSKQVTLNRMFGMKGPQTAGEYPNLCLLCGQSFKTVQAMMSHERWFHSVAGSSSQPSSISFPAEFSIKEALVVAAANDDGEGLSIVEQKDVVYDAEMGRPSERAVHTKGRG